MIRSDDQLCTRPDVCIATRRGKFSNTERKVTEEGNISGIHCTTTLLVYFAPTSTVKLM